MRVGGCGGGGGGVGVDHRKGARKGQLDGWIHGQEFWWTGYEKYRWQRNKWLCLKNGKWQKTFGEDLDRRRRSFERGCFCTLFLINVLFLWSTQVSEWVAHVKEGVSPSVFIQNAWRKEKQSKEMFTFYILLFHILLFPANVSMAIIYYHFSDTFNGNWW